MAERSTLTACALVAAVVIRILVTISLSVSNGHFSLGSMRQVLVASACVGAATLAATYLTRKPLGIAIVGGTIASSLLMADVYLNTALKYPHLLDKITASDWAVQAVIAGLVGFLSVYLGSRATSLLSARLRP